MSWISRLKNTFHPQRVEQDLTDEIRDHLARRSEDVQGRGMSSGEAERRAALRFGSIARVREESREVRRFSVIEDTIQDTRYAWRGLLRNPVFAVTAIVALGLAIGANTAIYSIIDAVMLRPLPVPRADQLFILASPEGGLSKLPESKAQETFSYPLYEQLRAAAGDAASLALFDSPNRVEAEIAGPNAEREEVIQQMVSANAFDALAVFPAAGQVFSPEDDRIPSSRAVVVLSYEYWQRRFGGDRAVLGQRVTVSGKSYSIIGVTRKGFTGIEPGKFVDLWLPVTTADPGIFTNAEYRPFYLVGRLGPGVTREGLTARLQPAFQQHQESRVGAGSALPPAVQEKMRHSTIAAGSAAHGVSAFRRTFSRPLWILLGIALGTLLIACANVASLLLARAVSRSPEMALRVSLGARRARLLRQLLTESLLIASLAGLGGWMFANIVAPLLVAGVAKQSDPIRLDLTLNPGVLLFCIAVCAASALLFGLLPAWQATSTAPMMAMRHGGGRAGRSRLGRIFIGVQVAFAFCLVTGGAGFLFSLRNLTAVDTGFDAHGVTVLTITDSAQQWDRQWALLQQMQLRAAALPNVESAATGWMALFSGVRRSQRVVLPGHAPSEREEVFYRVSPGYFAALRTPLLAGREITFHDNDNEPVATVVNLAFARRYFGSDSVLGLQFQRDDGVRHQIVGVAANSHFGDLRGGPEPIAYMPMKPTRGFTLYVRSPLDAPSVAAMVEREAKTLGSGMRVRDVTTLETLVGSTIAKEKLLATLGGAFALLGLVLAAIGLFGLLNYSVTRRTKEIGIRAALGAPRSRLFTLVMKDLFGMVAGGLVFGLAGSVLLMRLTASLLFGIQPADPRVIGTAMVVFIAAAVMAGGLPAHRAAKMDPLVALRHE